MKICIIARNINDDYSGSFEFDQAIALKTYGHEVSVISLDLRSIRNKRKFGFIMSNYKGINVLRCSFPISPIRGVLLDLLASTICKYAYQIVEKEFGCFDIIHSHFLSVSYIAMKACRKPSIPFVVTEHSSSVNKTYSELNKQIITKARYVYNKATKVIAVSESLADCIANNFGITCDVVYNAFDTSIFKFTPNYRKNERIIVSAGNLTENKRMDLLIRAFERAFKDDKRYVLVIFGDGPAKSELRKLIQALDLGERVLLKGHVHRTEIAEFYKTADLFVLLSKKETFGVAYIEAMASGLPVVSSFSGGPEGFITEETGIIVDDSIENISLEFQKIMKNIESYSPELISTYAKLICSPNTIAHKLTEIYTSIII